MRRALPRIGFLATTASSALCWLTLVAAAPGTAAERAPSPLGTLATSDRSSGQDRPPPSGGISGRVLDDATGEALIGASVALVATLRGVHTDQKGRFRLFPLPPGRYDVLVTFVGYRPARVNWVVATGPQRDLVVRLLPTAVDLPAVVVTATRRAQTFAESPVSISVTDRQAAMARNSLTLISSLYDTPGVSRVGSHVSVRGSSGYSRGTGSRVLLLMDGTPIVSADNADIKWDVIPPGRSSASRW